MEISVAVTLDEAQQRAIGTELARIGSAETMDAFVSRMAAKIISGWVNQNQQEFIAKNRPMVEQLVQDLAIDPERQVKLAALGVEFVDGVLQPLPPPADVKV